MRQKIENESWIGLSNPTCPICDYKIDYSKFEGGLLGENRLECPNCGQMLDITGEVEYSFSTMIVKEV